MKKNCNHKWVFLNHSWYHERSGSSVLLSSIIDVYTFYCEKCLAIKRIEQE